MKDVKVICPNCGETIHFKNYWHWIWNTPFHWLWFDKETKIIRDYRKTKCPHCGERSFMKRTKG